MQEFERGRKISRPDAMRGERSARAVLEFGGEFIEGAEAGGGRVAEADCASRQGRRCHRERPLFVRGGVLILAGNRNFRFSEFQFDEPQGSTVQVGGAFLLAARGVGVGNESKMPRLDPIEIIRRFLESIQGPDRLVEIAGAGQRFDRIDGLHDDEVRSFVGRGDFQEAALQVVPSLSPLSRKSQAKSL